MIFVILPLESIVAIGIVALSLPMIFPPVEAGGFDLDGLWDFRVSPVMPSVCAGIESAMGAGTMDAAPAMLSLERAASAARVLSCMPLLSALAAAEFLLHPKARAAAHASHAAAGNFVTVFPCA